MFSHDLTGLHLAILRLSVRQSDITRWDRVVQTLGRRKYTLLSAWMSRECRFERDGNIFKIICSSARTYRCVCEHLEEIKLCIYGVFNVHDIFLEIHDGSV